MKQPHTNLSRDVRRDITRSAQKKARVRGLLDISGGDGEFAYMLQAAAWLASQALRISHAMSAGTSLAPHKKQNARLRGHFDISGGDGV